MKTERFREKIGAVVFGKVLMLIVSMISSIYFSRILLAEGKGQLAVINSVAGIYSQFCNMGLHSAHTYYISKDNSNVAYAEGNIILAFIFSIIVSLISFPLFILFPEIFKLSKLHVAIALLTFIVSLVLMLQENIFLAIGKIKLFNLIQILSTAINILLVFIASFICKIDVTKVALLSLVGQVIIFIYSVLCNSLPRPIVRLSFLKYIFPYGVKSYLSCLITYLLLRIDVLMMNYFLDSREVGLYSLAVNLSDMLYIFSSSVSTVLFPQLSKFNSTKERAILLRKVFTHIIPLVAGAALMLWVSAEFVIKVLFGEDYIGSIPLLRILVVASFLWGISGYLFNFLSAEDNLMPTIIVPIIALLVNLGLNSIFIPLYGGAGAAVASVISYACECVLLAIIVLRYIAKSNR